MSEQIKLLLYIKNMLSDLIYLNTVIATELIKITENSAAQRHGEEFFKQTDCINEHHQLNKDILSILKKYYKTTEEEEKVGHLNRHVLKHSKE